MTYSNFPCSPDYVGLGEMYQQYPISFKRISDSFKNLRVSIAHSLKPSDYKISCFTSREVFLDSNLTQRLKAFEQEISYPYSDQEDFTIEHGKDGAAGYNGFFDTLGKPYFYIAQCKKTKIVKVKGEKEVFLRKRGEIAAVICCVLRKVKSHNGNAIKAWYICDLKVGKNHRGEHLPTALIKSGAWRILQCRRGFAVCKDLPNSQMSKSAKIGTQHSVFSGLLKTTPFNQYRLDATQVRENYDKIKEAFPKDGARGRKKHLTFLSNDGLNDYQGIDKKTGERRHLQLLHIVPRSEGRTMPEEGYDHIISAVQGTPLDTTLKKIKGCEPSLTGRYISCGMRGFDFNQITSAEI